MTVHIVDTPEKVVSLLKDIENQPTKPPSLYLDIEGVRLSRHGSISIIQLFNAPQNQVFLIDIFVLRQAAFDTPNRSGITLRSILESGMIPKVFFDVRNDSDALFAHFNIVLRGSQDVQLLKAATQPLVKRLAGLKRCIEQDAQLSVDVLKEWQMVKAMGKKWFTAKKGESYEAFNVRPLLQDVITYCAQDVVHLPILWSTYSDRLIESWHKRVVAETTKRVMLSQSESYDPSGDDKVLSPWANNVKDKYPDGSKKSNMRRKEGNEHPTMTDQRPKGQMSVVQIVNMKLTHRQSGKVLGVHSSFPGSVGNTERQASKGIMDKDVPKIKPQFPLSQTALPTRSKGKAKVNPVGEVHHKMHTPVTSTAWTCTTCGRNMQESQKENHLVGKAHIARAKQVPSAGANRLSLPSTGENVISQTAKTSTTKERRAKAKAKAETTSGKAKFGGTLSKSSQRRARTAVKSTYASNEPYGSADCGFVGFNKGLCLGSYEQVYGLGGGNYGLCDKDCGWCGNCMDNVDI